ncbi:unnamed protein product [Ceratitis capitata]|uniref:(Mediterranean fruit fly) hypothetical protein n=1 Tax=Ceratitis capitata TaxID=7213 RepID=A0A811UI74_CERCA|nr:unnamed protein product [Ceratitis capitata]
MNDEILLSYIEQHPELYSKSNPYYKYIEIKRGLWELIGKEMNMSGKHEIYIRSLE